MNIVRRKLFGLITLFLILLYSACAFATTPDCTDPDAWPCSMAFTYLKNARILNNDELDFSKTVITRLSSEKIGKDLYRQIHLIRFTNKSGAKVVVITINLQILSVLCQM
jgi:hypothetical protein